MPLGRVPGLQQLCFEPSVESDCPLTSLTYKGSCSISYGPGKSLQAPRFSRLPPSGSPSLPSLSAPSIHSINIVDLSKIYENIKAHLQFSKGFTRASVQTVLMITQYVFSYNMSDSFLSYQFVRANLLVCMPALGGRQKNNEIAKTLYRIPTTPKKSTNMRHVGKQNSCEINQVR